MVRRAIGWGLLLLGAMAAATVLAAPPTISPGQDLLLEAELESAQVYVQTQAIYRLRFYQAVDVSDLQITGPSARLADVRPIGTGRVYEALRDGRRYRVHERSYAVFPFSSGSLKLSGAHVLGRVTAGAAKSTDGRYPLRLEVADQTLTVYPAPAAAGDGPWLPASSLTLSESWSPPATQVRPGQALRRSIRIQAVGIDAGQISPLQVTAPGMLVDAEPPRLENRITGELNIGVREQTFRMVALRAGDIVLPELKLLWWDLDADALASATLPSRSVHVTADDAALAAVPPMTPVPAPAQASTSASNLSQGMSKLETTAPATPNRWPLLLVALALLCAGLALAYARRPGVRAAWRLQRACRLGNAAAVRDGLLQWAAAVWPQAPPLTLEMLAERVPDPATRQALAALDRCLYGPNPGPCDAAELGAAVRAIKRGIRQFASSSRAAR